MDTKSVSPLCPAIEHSGDTSENKLFTRSEKWSNDTSDRTDSEAIKGVEIVVSVGQAEDKENSADGDNSELSQKAVVVDEGNENSRAKDDENGGQEDKNNDVIDGEKKALVPGIDDSVADLENFNESGEDDKDDLKKFNDRDDDDDNNNQRREADNIEGKEEEEEEEEKEEEEEEEEDTSGDGEYMSELLTNLEGLDYLENDFDENEENYDETNKPQHPVDKGYSWVIMIAVFCAQFLVMGYMKSLGILFVEIQERFGTNSSMTSSIVGLLEGVGSFGSFLVMGSIIKRSSPRTVGLIGSFFIFLGVAGNGLLTQPEFLYVTQGLFFGLGFAGTFGPSLLVLTQYFEKKRALATAISTCGTSLGGVVFPLLFRNLLDEYAYRGGVVLVAAVTMHLFLCFGLMTPIQNFYRRSDPNKKVEVMSQSSARGHDLRTLDRMKHRFANGGQSFLGHGDDIHSLDSRPGSLYNKDVKSEMTKLPFGNYTKNYNTEQFSSRLEICEEGKPLKIEHNAVVDPEAKVAASAAQSRNASDNLRAQNLSAVSRESFNSDAKSMRSRSSTFHEPNSPVPKRTTLDSQYISPPLPSSFWSLASDQNTSVYDTDSLMYNHGDGRQPYALGARKPRQHLSRSSMLLYVSTSSLHTNIADMISVQQEHMPKDSPAKPSLFHKLCLSCSNNPMIKCASFWVLGVFFFCACIGQALPQMYIVPLAQERGVSEADAAFFLSIMNILDFPAHILPGAIVNFRLLRAPGVCIVPMLIISVVGQLTPLFHSYHSILGMVIVYGVFAGVYFAMQSLIVIDVLGLEHYSECIGFFYLVMGLGAAVSYPIAGMLKDVTGTYSSSFHYLATMQLVAVLCLLITPLAKRYDQKRGLLV